MSAEPFKTMDDIEEYFSNDRLTCLVCGRTFKALIGHIYRKHGISADEYKERFGLPFQRGLVTPDLHSKLREISSAPDKIKKSKALGKIFGPLTRPGKQRKCEADLLRLADRMRNKRAAGEIVTPRKYNTFSWHLQICEREFNYERIQPPDGHASWKTFQKRRLKDADLNSLFKSARKLMQKTPQSVGYNVKCAHGDKYLYVSPSGSRHCRECNREATARYRGRKRATGAPQVEANETGK